MCDTWSSAAGPIIRMPQQTPVKQLGFTLLAVVARLTERSCKQRAKVSYCHTDGNSSTALPHSRARLRSLPEHLSCCHPSIGG
jgi:hypothetical protein